MIQNIIIRIGGMSCQHCVKAVEKVLSELEGVNKVRVDLAKGQAMLEIDEHHFKLDEAARSLDREGYALLGIGV